MVYPRRSARRGVVEMEAIARLRAEAEELAEERVEDSAVRDDEDRPVMPLLAQPVEGAARPLVEVLRALRAARYEVAPVLHPFGVFLGVHLRDLRHDPPLEDAELDLPEERRERERDVRGGAA